MVIFSGALGGDRIIYFPRTWLDHLAWSPGLVTWLGRLAWGLVTWLGFPLAWLLRLAPSLGSLARPPAKSKNKSEQETWKIKKFLRNRGLLSTFQLYFTKKSCYEIDVYSRRFNFSWSLQNQWKNERWSNIPSSFQLFNKSLKNHKTIKKQTLIKHTFFVSTF